MKYRLSLFVSLFAAALLVLAACAPAGDGGQQEAMPAAEEAGDSMGDGEGLQFIAVQHAECAWDSFWCTVQSGINTAAADTGVEVTILAPDEFDLDKTASLIEQAVAANPDGIMLTVTDPVLFKEPIMKAIDAGIPVIAYNAGSGPIADNIPYYTYLGQDEYQGGYLGGLRLAAGGGTQGVCINQQVGHTGLDKRCAGFADALAESGIASEVLAIGDDPAEAATIIGDYFTANPDTDIFLTLGPNGANPFYVFVENEGLGADDIVHGTFDLGEEIKANIESGMTMFGIDQQPFLQGYGGVTTLIHIVRYGILPALPVTATGPGFVDAASLAKQPDADAPVSVIAVQHAECAWDSFWCVVAERHQHRGGRDGGRRDDSGAGRVRPGQDGVADRAGGGGQSGRHHADGDRPGPVQGADHEGDRRRHSGHRLQCRLGSDSGPDTVLHLPGAG